MQLTPSVFRSTSSSFRVYYCAMVCLTAGLLVWALWHARIPPVSLIALWLVLYVLSLALRIPAEKGTYMSVSSALDYAGLVLLGPAFVAALNAVATIGYETAIRQPRHKAIFNASLYALMVLCAGAAFELSRAGMHAIPALATWRGGWLVQGVVPGLIVPMLIAGAVYVSVNQICLSTVLALHDNVPLRQVWEKNHRSMRVFALVSISTGLVIAQQYENGHIFGVVVSVLPLILFWYYFQLYAEIRGDLRQFVRALTSIIEEVDPYTRNHSYRVAEYAKRIARELRMQERQVETVEFGGLLHDLGKVREDVRSILRKDAPMDASERRAMDTHANTGADIVNSIRALRGVAVLVRAHHERPDGRGYPHGLKGEEIPLGARIILVADTFDAMTSDRPYRKALTAERAVAELQKYAGAQFDRDVVAAVVRLHEAGDFPVLYQKPSPNDEDSPLPPVLPLRATAS